MPLRAKCKEGAVHARTMAPTRHGTARAVTNRPSYAVGMSTETAQQWICESCGFIYDPAEGDPDGGIPPGTAFEDIPERLVLPRLRGAQGGLHPVRGLSRAPQPGPPAPAPPPHGSGTPRSASDWLA